MRLIKPVLNSGLAAMAAVAVLAAIWPALAAVVHAVLLACLVGSAVPPAALLAHRAHRALRARRVQRAAAPARPVLIASGVEPGLLSQWRESA